MRPSDGAVPASRFERRIPAGQHDMLFKVVFGSDAKAARALGYSTMQIWRWRHDRSPLPERVAEILTELIQSKVMEVHEAQNQLRYYLALPPKPPRPLSGACAGYSRKLGLKMSELHLLD
jgi:hypothetical protein